MPYDLGDPSFYPRARARLIVRFEEWADVASTPAPPSLPPQNRRGAGKDPGAKLVVEEDQGKLVLVEPGQAPSQARVGPQDQTTSADGRTFVIEGVVPISADLQYNGVRQADTLTMTLQWRDFPFDPSALRSIAVKYFDGCVSADDADRGAQGQYRANATVGGDSLPYGTIPDMYVDPFGRQRTNLRFEGFADVHKMRLDESSGTVSLECTDNTQLPMDQEAPPRLTVSAKLPIDRAIAEYMAAFPQFRGLSVEYRPATPDAQKPVLGKVLLPTAKAQKDAGPTPGGASTGTSKLSVWDYLTDVVGMVGHVLRVEGTSLVVQRARTLFGGQYSRPDDPFTGREVSGNGQPPILFSTRMYAYGINVTSIEKERQHRRHETTSIEVRSYSTSRKKTIVVRFPEKGDRVRNLKPGQASELKFEVHRVSGVEDLKTLKIVAQNIYEAKSRNELAVRIETKCLASFGGDGLDPDALDLREGDPVRVEVARQPGDDGANSITDLQRGAADMLVALGFPRDLAEAYERARSRSTFPTLFRVRTVTHSWANDQGISLALELVNYVEVRADKGLPDGEEPSPPTSSQASPVEVRVSDEVG